MKKISLFQINSYGYNPLEYLVINVEDSGVQPFELKSTILHPIENYNQTGFFHKNEFVRDLTLPEIVKYRLQGILRAEDIL